MTDATDGPADPGPADRRMSPWLAGAIGMALGIVITTVVAVMTDDDPEPVDPGPASTVVDPGVVTSTTTDPEADAEQAALVDAFLDAWFRYRTGTFTIEWQFERRLDNGDVLPSTAVLVQRPPDRLYGLLESVSGSYAGEQVNCDASSEERRCFTTTSSEEYIDQMRDEQGTRSTYFLGDPPLYTLSSPGAGCFDVTATTPATFLPWGAAAQFCFDDATGALVSSLVDYGDLTESFASTSVATAVTDDNFTTLLDG